MSDTDGMEKNTRDLAQMRRSYEQAAADEMSTLNGYVIEGEHPEFGPVRAVGSPVRFSDTPAICTHGSDAGIPTGAPRASNPSKRTGPQSSANAKAAISGDLPQPFALRSTDRDQRNRPRSSTAYR